MRFGTKATSGEREFLDAPNLAFPINRSPDIVLKIKLWLRLLVLAATLASIAGMFALSYADRYVDGRFFLFLVQIAAFDTLALRARIVVVDGVAWRRGFRAYKPVSLDRLRTIEFRRAKLKENGGLLPARRLSVLDDYGRLLLLKPALWSNNDRLAATTSAAARAQAVEIEAAASAALRSAADGATGVPVWAYRGPRILTETAGRQSVRTTEPRDWLGIPRSAHKRVLAQAGAFVAVAAVFLPGALVASRASTRAVRAAHCNSSRALWADAPDFPQGTDTWGGEAQAVMTERINGAPAAGMYTLGADQIADRDNSPAVQRDARALVDGIDVGWSEGLISKADVYFENFPTHAAAVAYQRDYLEDHCHMGDRAFAVPGIPGAVGLRCGCQALFDDRVAFVRGTTRVQAMVWELSDNDDHHLTVNLARAALDAHQG